MVLINQLEFLHWIGDTCGYFASDGPAYLRCDAVLIRIYITDAKESETDLKREFK